MFQRARKPAFAIAFVNARFFFLQACQISLKSEYFSFGLYKDCPKISAWFLKSVGNVVGQSCREKLSSKVAEQSCQVKLSAKVVGKSCQAKFSGKAVKQSCQAKLSSRIGQAEFSVEEIFKERKFALIY